MSENSQNKQPQRKQDSFMGGPPMGRPPEKAKNFKKSTMRLISYLKPFKINLTIVIIFAILSTVFTIAGPKISGQAMNKLQDGFMAKMMIEKMSDAQKNAVTQIQSKMEEAQISAVNEIEKQMADTQNKLVNQFKTQISQMSAFQGSLQSKQPISSTGKTQGLNASQNTNPAATQIPSAETMAAIKDIMALTAIDKIDNQNEKAQVTIKFIDLLAKMPTTTSSSQDSSTQAVMTSEQLDTVKELLSIPQLKSVTEKSEKVRYTQELLDVFSKMPQSKETTNSNEEKFDKTTLTSLKEFISLSVISEAQNGKEKAKITRKFMDLGSKMNLSKDTNQQFSSKGIELTDEQIDNAITAIEETNGEYDFKYIGLIVLILIGMYLVSAGFSLIMGLVMSGVAQKTVFGLRKDVDNKLEKLPLKYYDLHPHGDILSRVTNDIDTISTTLQQSITQVITSIISILGFIIMMLTISPLLTLIVIGTLPVYIFVTVIIAKQSQKFFAAQQKEIGLLSGHVEEMYTGHKIVKAFGKEKDSIKKFSEINERLYKQGWKAQFVSGIMFPLMNFIGNLGYVFICIFGGLWITNGMLKIGDMLAFIQYSRQFTMPIVQTANIANIIQSTIACAERVFEILDEEEEIPEKTGAIAIKNPKGNVLIENVDFTYNPDEPLIENMNLDVKPGHTVAIVGPTGAGKTTLVNLLMRFYEINKGKISIDGMDIKELKRKDLRSMFGMVLQDTWLFNGTIRDNIAYGKLDASEDEIIRAAKAAHADYFIRTLPEGYNTVLNEEATNISQGQKQLLTIARAILANPTILILDEATSSVDTRTEVLIQKAMTNLMQDRTSFVIAHRLSTIRDAELILVMNKGSIIEQGNHKELLEKGGFYADLYNSQFAGANLAG